MSTSPTTPTTPTTRRREDAGLITGTTPFLADLPAADCLAVAFVRSQVAHADVRSIDVDEARRATGVVAVFTAADLGLAPYRFFDQIPAPFARPPLATDRVRFAGELLAVVVARTDAEAVDAAELVVADLEPLPAVVGADAALADGATVLFPEHGSNVVLSYERPPVDGLFDAAAVVVEGRFPNQRLASAPLEPDGIVVRPAGDRLDVWATCQGVHLTRRDLARGLGIEESAIRVRAGAVGGGFGGRHSAPIEFVVVAAVARRLGRALRWVSTRSENLLSMVHGRAQTHEVSAGFDDDGRLVALRVHNLADCGAYPHFGPLMPFMGRKLACGPYRVPAVDYRWTAYATTTNPVGAYRGAGQPEVTNGLERIMDLAAVRLGLDPLEVRLRNLLGSDELPHTTVTGLTYDSGDYPAALRRATELVGWDRYRTEQAERRARGDGRQLGLGVACYVSATSGRTEFGAVSVDEAGEVTVRTGTFSHGQSHATVVGGVVASVLGVDPDRVHYVDADSDAVPHGQGTGGSRSAQMAGSAALRAAQQVLERARALAAHHLEAAPDDVVVVPAGPAADGGRTGPGGLAVAGVPASLLTWPELARLAAGDAAGPLAVELDLDLDGSAFSSGAHVSVVEVDVETGAVRLLAHVAVDDCGTVLDAGVVAGQQHGGSVAGIGQALLEDVVVDADGTPRSVTFADYLIPSAAEVPSIVTATMDIPTPIAPNGAKGIGENGAVAAPSSVQNAVVDALRPFGVTHLDLPLTPERIWRALS
jgi:carbon-monoxide dehydrogenase large subunit